MNFMKKIFIQTRKPEGILGRMMIKSMNSGHAKMAAWGTARLPELHPRAIVDLGCGGGKNAENLMKKFPSATMTAVDYSEACVEASKKHNASAVSSGRFRIVQGDVSGLCLESSQYDLATAFETVYFWPGPVKSFREVYRVLKSGGSFLIVNECDGTNEKDQKWLDMIDGMSIYPEKELIGHLKEAGFSDIQVFRDTKKHWICFLAKKI